MTREDFIGVIQNAISGLGFDQDISVVTFPMALFLTDSDLEPLQIRLREFVRGLTSWQPAEAKLGLKTAPSVAVEAESENQAFEKANNLYQTNLWGDGLPLLPATRERVDWILRGTALAPKDVLGKFLPRGGVTSVETVAISLAMAGGRPEYLAVLIAAVQAMFDPKTNYDRLQSASGNAFPIVIVNGPVGGQIRLSSDYGCLGPDPQRPAGASIGRALRLLQQNVGGALPGVGTVAVYGGMRTTNAVFAEDESGLPEGWAAHNTERHGFEAGKNSVSVVWVSGMTNIKRRGAGDVTAEEEARESLDRTADYMRVPNLHYLYGYEEGTPGILMITSANAKELAATGWTKEKIRGYLWEASKIPQSDNERSGVSRWLAVDADEAVLESLKIDPWPITANPENINIVVTGGAHPTNCYWMQGYCPYVAGYEISIPGNFYELLFEAMDDMGSGGEACLI